MLKTIQFISLYKVIHYRLTHTNTLLITKKINLQTLKIKLNIIKFRKLIINEI